MVWLALCFAVGYAVGLINPRVAAVYVLLIAVLWLLIGCGGGDGEQCPQITEANIERAVAAPSGSACAQVLLPDGVTREQWMLCQLGKAPGEC